MTASSGPIDPRGNDGARRSAGELSWPGKVHSLPPSNGWLLFERLPPTRRERVGGALGGGGLLDGPAEGPTLPPRLFRRLPPLRWRITSTLPRRGESVSEDSARCVRMCRFSTSGRRKVRLHIGHASWCQCVRCSELEASSLRGCEGRIKHVV